LTELYDNIFIVAVFDCCRLRKDVPKLKPEEKKPAPTKGGGVEEE
jgi:hypothetical protein